MTARHRAVEGDLRFNGKRETGSLLQQKQRWLEVLVGIVIDLEGLFETCRVTRPPRCVLDLLRSLRAVR